MTKGVLSFTKYHGLGNDFVVLDRLTSKAGALSANEAVYLCDRNRGIGADGVLTIWPHDGADGRMQIQNADGSDGGMCGNGLRCVLRYMYDEGLRDPTHTALTFRVGNRDYHSQRLSADVYKVNMGPAADIREVVIDVGDRTFAGTYLSMGNPHVVIFVDDDPSALATTYGHAVATHSMFAKGANASFVRVGDKRLETIVHERGVGRTQACGSGACAVAEAAIQLGHAARSQPVVVVLPGGILRITRESNADLWMEGPATRVFRGELDLPA